MPAGAAGEPDRRGSGHQKTGSLFRPPRSLAWRLGTTYLLTTLFIVLTLSLAIYLAAAFYLDGQLERELAAQADFYAAFAANLARDEATLAGLAPTIVSMFAPQADLTVRLFAARDGSLLAATQDIGPQPSHVALIALGYRSPTLFVQPSRDLPRRRYAAQPIRVGQPPAQRTIGVVEVSRSTLSIERSLASLRQILLAALLGALALSLVVSALMARRLSQPIRAMEEATRRIAAGDLDVRVGDDREDKHPQDELERLGASIDHMARRLKHLETARARFVSEIAHDLRTPLTAIKGLLVNLIDDAGPAGQPSLEMAEQETDRLIRLVNQLLDFSRWQAGQLELNPSPVDVGDIARNAVTLSQGRAHHRGVTLTVDIAAGLPVLSADPDRLSQVILNLLDNAIKFTPAGGQVMLRAGYSQDQVASPPKGEVKVSVHDTGRGMSEAEQAQAFEAYYRGPGGGSGLGLTIARAIVEAHGGRIGIESKPGCGSQVWFTLPLQPST
ncbi:MAG: hypothetical protein Kow0063_45140 [Anaerolineae bacterium]